MSNHDLVQRLLAPREDLDDFPEIRKLQEAVTRSRLEPFKEEARFQAELDEVAPLGQFSGYDEAYTDALSRATTLHAIDRLTQEREQEVTKYSQSKARRDAYDKEHSLFGFGLVPTRAIPFLDDNAPPVPEIYQPTFPSSRTEPPAAREGLPGPKKPAQPPTPRQRQVRSIRDQALKDIPDPPRRPGVTPEGTFSPDTPALETPQSLRQKGPLTEFGPQPGEFEDQAALGLVPQADGSVSSRKSITVIDDRLGPGEWEIPLLVPGNEAAAYEVGAHETDEQGRGLPHGEIFQGRDPYPEEVERAVEYAAQYPEMKRPWKGPPSQERRDLLAPAGILEDLYAPPKPVPEDLRQEAVEVRQSIGDGLIQATNNFIQGTAEVPAGLLKSVGVLAKAIDEQVPVWMQNYQGKKTEELATYQVGVAIEAFAQKHFPTNKKRRKEFLAAVLPHAMGNMLGFMVGGAVGQMARLNRTATTLALGSGVEGAGQYKEAKQFGADESTARKAFLYGLGLGATEAIPIQRMLARIDQATGGTATKILRTGGLSALEEFIQEWGQTVGGNAVAQRLYDEDRTLFEGAGIAGAAGGTSALIFSVLLGGVKGQLARRQRAKGEGGQLTPPAVEGVPTDPTGATTPEGLPVFTLPEQTVEAEPLAPPFQVPDAPAAPSARQPEDPSSSIEAVAPTEPVPPVEPIPFLPEKKGQDRPTLELPTPPPFQTAPAPDAQDRQSEDLETPATPVQGPPVPPIETQTPSPTVTQPDRAPLELPVPPKAGTTRSTEQIQKDLDKIEDAVPYEELDTHPEYLSLVEEHHQAMQREYADFLASLESTKGVSRDELQQGLSALNLTPEYMPELAYRNLKRWGVDTALHIESIYNRLSKPDEADDYVRFYWGGTAESPSLESDRSTDPELLKKTEAIYNAVASQIGEAPISLTPKVAPTPKSPVRQENRPARRQAISPETPEMTGTPAGDVLPLMPVRQPANATPLPSETIPLLPPTPIDAQAHEAATSPANTLPEPTPDQKKAGNYKKGHVTIAGLPISIENPAGSERSGTDPDGQSWRVTMKSHYGYIKGTEGKDKDHLDVFVKPGTAEDYDGPVFVVNQVNPKTNAFDEHKIILGAATQEEAERLYRENYAKGWKGLGSMVEFSMDQFKSWLASGKTKQPARGMAQEKKPTPPLLPEEDGPAEARPVRPPVIQHIMSPEVQEKHNQEAIKEGTLKEGTRVRWVHRNRKTGEKKTLTGIVAEPLTEHDTFVTVAVDQRARIKGKIPIEREEVVPLGRIEIESELSDPTPARDPGPIVIKDLKGKTVEKIPVTDEAKTDEAKSEPAIPFLPSSTPETPRPTRQEPATTPTIEAATQEVRDEPRRSQPAAESRRPSHPVRRPVSGQPQETSPEGVSPTEGERDTEGASARRAGPSPSNARTTPDERRDVSRSLREGRDRTPVSSERESESPVTAPAEPHTPPSKQSPIQRGDAQPETTAPQTQSATVLDYHIQESDDLEAGGQKTKFQRNFDAIRLLKTIEREGRQATAEEQATLVRYTGWGGLPQAFNLYGEWRKEALELQQLLTKDEYAAAKRSTTNAHYTSPDVVREIYRGLERLGWTHGRVLEPGAGIGHFFGLMPKAMARRSARTAVELDTLSGRILKQLYQGANVHIGGFETLAMPDNFYDLAIGNVPFADVKVHEEYDKDLNLLHLSLHDFFFAKALKKVRPGGVIVFITSRYTMDKKNARFRQYLAERADLLGAIRLPSNAFKGIANTEVTTDIIILRKRQPNTPATGESWTGLAETTLRDADNTPLRINEYFVRHPEMMLGRMSLEGSMYRAQEPTLSPDGRNLRDALRDAFARLPENIIEPPSASPATMDTTLADRLPAPGDVKDGAYAVEGDTLYIKKGHELVPLSNVPALTLKRIKGMMAIRDALREVFRTQLEEAPEADILAARKDLNRHYDRFVKAYGFLHQLANKRAFQEDPDYPTLAALEHWDSKAKTASKAAIFTQRTIRPRVKAQRAGTVQEALLVSLNETNRVDLDRIAALTQQSPEEAAQALGELIYENPEGGWETKEEYLSGNIRHKLSVAKAASEIDARYARNVPALEAALPKDLHPSQISVRLGVSWVPASDIEQFLAETLGASHVSVYFNEALGKWTINDVRGANPAALRKKWGTARMAAHDIAEATLNSQSPTIYDTVEEKRVLNKKETFAVREMQAKWREYFREWLWKDPERSQRLARYYNDHFNAIRSREYSGEHLTLPGSNPAIAFRPHQKDGIARILQAGNTLIAHEVGTGKTYTLIGAAMESRRLGLAQKPIIVVPKHLVEYWRNAFLELYPTANVLMPTPRDFEKSNRRKLIGRIATGDWDAIVVSHSAFSRIPVSKETEVAYLNEQLAIMEEFLEGERLAQGRKARSVKEIEKAKRRLEEKLKRRLDKPEDPGVTFEETGIDMLLVDEADLFKNLFYATRMTQVAGLSNSDSQRANDLYLKTRYLSRLNNGRNIVFATGTPISNTMAEVFTMQRYLQQETLNRLGLSHFDSWARQFAEEVTGIELSPTGQWRTATRFSKFVNLPDLMRIFGQVMDVQFAADVGIRRPPLKTGKPINVTAPASEALKSYTQELVKRADNLKNVDPAEDNMLKIANDGRHAALDIRLRMPGLPEDPKSKVNLAAQKIAEIYHKTADMRGTQLLFLDLATPKGKEPLADTSADPELAAASSEVESVGEQETRKSVYAQIRDKLIAQGVKAEEIAFIHEADTDRKKTELFERMNRGEVRILLGSTERLGAGTNVQKRLVALHNLDAPWRPRDLEQRNGRILRPGNELLETIPGFEVAIYNYATEAPSFDVRMWQTLESKAKMIQQIMHADPTIREMEDVDIQVLSISEMKAIASGNPIIMEKVQVDADVMRLSALERQHQESAIDSRMRLANIPERRAALEATLRAFEESRKVLDAHPQTAFTIEIDGTTYTKRDQAGDAIVAQAQAAFRSGHMTAATPIGMYRGMRFVISHPARIPGNEEKLTFTVALMPPNTASVTLAHVPHGQASTGIGAIQSIESAIRGMGKTVETTQAALTQLDRTEAELKDLAEQPFPHAGELAKRRKRQREIADSLRATLEEGSGIVEETESSPPTRLTIREEGRDQSDTEGSPPHGAPMPHGARRTPTPTARIPIAPIPGRTPKPLKEIRASITKKLQIKIVTGKPGRGLAGEYQPTSTATIIRYAGDLDTTAHELGHALDDRFGIVSAWKERRQRSPFDEELEKFWQHGSVRKSGPRSRLAYKRAEGVAEYLRAWLVNPQAAEAAAPRFHQWLMGRLDAETIAALRAFGDDIRVFAGASPHDQIMANVQWKPAADDSMWSWLTGGQDIKSPGFSLTWGDRVAMKITDRLHPLMKAIEYAKQAKGIPHEALAPEKSPNTLVRLFMGIHAKMDDIFANGMITPRHARATEGGITWLLEPLDTSSAQALERDMQEVITFMLAQRTVEKAEQVGRENVSGIGGGVASDVEVARARLDEIAQEPGRHARLQEAARRYRQWANANLRYLLGKGRLSQEQYDAIVANNEYYVAMQRILEVGDNEPVVVLARAGGGRKVGTVWQPIQAFKGSTREIQNPYLSLIDATYRAVREADRNDIMRQFRALLVTDRTMHEGQPLDLASVGRLAKAGEPHTIPIFVDGQAEHWQFHPDVYRALKGVQDGIYRLPPFLTILPRILRATIVHAPPFAFRNIIRDAWHRTIISNRGSKPWESLQKFTPMEISQLKLHGGDQAGHYYQDTVQYYRAMKAAIQELTPDPTHIIVNLKKAGRAYLAMIEHSERRGRLAEYRHDYRYAREQLGYDEYNASLYAAGKARELMDYAIGGEWTVLLNQLIPFTKAAVQGVRVNLKRIHENPAQYARRFGIWAVLPSLLTWLWNWWMGDLDEYRALPAHQRDLFWNFKVGPDLWLKIPKSFEIGVLATSFERAWDYAAGNAQAFEGHVGAFLRTLLPLDEASFAGPYQALVQAAANFDFPRQRTIVPKHEIGLDLSLRNTQRASRLGQAMQEAIGMDARLIDFFLRQQFGYAGQFAMLLSDVGRTDRRPMGWQATGLASQGPVTASLDVQWVKDMVARRGAYSDPQWKNFDRELDRYYRARTPQHRDVMGRRIRRLARRLRAQWERRPPRPEAERQHRMKVRREERAASASAIPFFATK